jgi:hypothetical protein
MAMICSVNVMTVFKVSRQRLELSPDLHQYALLSRIGMITGLAAFQWCKKYHVRGHPSGYIAILLGYGYDNVAATIDAVMGLHREIDFDDLHIVVTRCCRTFWSLCACGQLETIESTTVHYL